MGNIVKFDPFAEMQALQKQFFGEDWLMPVKTLQPPTTDVYTNDNKQLTVEAHLPNFEEKDVDVNLDGNNLVISAEKHEQEKDKNKKYIVRESSSSFYRRINLPNIADDEKIEAHFKDGILTINVPFKDLPAPKKISIKGKSK